jgi:prepilin-type N-terminal cleavage/methylation domain-containing protein
MGHFSRSFAAGFSLVEVLVASSIGAILGALTLQGIGLATTIQSRSIEKTEATHWVRDELEDLRLQSSNLTFDADLCQPATADHRGFARSLRDALAASSTTGTDPIVLPIRQITSSTGRTFQLVRTAWIEETFPYNVLGLRYEVLAAGANTPIYRFYTEAIPDAAFQCP